MMQELHKVGGAGSEYGSPSSQTIVISDHLIDEELLSSRLCDIFGEQTEYTWQAGTFKIHNAPKDKWKKVGRDEW